MCSTGAERAQMIKLGKLRFKTCPRQVYIPASHIVRLHVARYDNVPAGHPASFKEAVDHWLLQELLTAIGGVTSM